MDVNQRRAVEFGNARVRVQARRRAELVAGVADALNGSLNVRRVVLRFLELLRADFADWAVVALPEGPDLQVYGGDDSTRLGRVSQWHAPGLTRLLTSGQSELLHVSAGDELSDGLTDLVPDPELREQAAGLRPVDVLGTALTARGTVIGAIVLVRGGGRGFTVRDVAAAEEMGRRAAVAVDSARLYLERIETARVLWAGLRPQKLPAVAGLELQVTDRWAPTGSPAGVDLYDLVENDGRISVLLGHAHGGGVEAAASALRLRQAARTARCFTTGSAAVLAATTGSWEAAQQPCGKAQVHLTHLDGRRDGAAWVFDAAMQSGPPPVRVSAAGVATIASSGEIRLRPGELLVLCSHRAACALSVEPSPGQRRSADGTAARYDLRRLAELAGEYAGAGARVLCQALERDLVDSGMDPAPITLIVLQNTAAEPPA